MPFLSAHTVGSFVPNRPETNEEKAGEKDSHCQVRGSSTVVLGFQEQVVKFRQRERLSSRDNLFQNFTVLVAPLLPPTGYLIRFKL